MDEEIEEIEALYPQSPYPIEKGVIAPDFDIPRGHQRIREERERQIHEKGYDRKHDMQHDVDELIIAANCYLYDVVYPPFTITPEVITPASETPVPRAWPWEAESWNPSDDKIRNMVKAGALYWAASDLMETVSHNIGDLIDQEIVARLEQEGLL